MTKSFLGGFVVALLLGSSGSNSDESAVRATLHDNSYTTLFYDNLAREFVDHVKGEDQGSFRFAENARLLSFGAQAGKLQPEELNEEAFVATVRNIWDPYNFENLEAFTAFRQQAAVVQIQPPLNSESKPVILFVEGDQIIYGIIARRFTDQAIGEMTPTEMDERLKLESRYQLEDGNFHRVLIDRLNAWKRNDSGAQSEFLELFTPDSLASRITGPRASDPPRYREMTASTPETSRDDDWQDYITRWSRNVSYPKVASYYEEDNEYGGFILFEAYWDANESRLTGSQVANFEFFSTGSSEPQIKANVSYPINRRY